MDSLMFLGCFASHEGYRQVNMGVPSVLTVQTSAETQLPEQEKKRGKNMPTLHEHYHPFK